jgi:cysteine desulfurase
VLSEMGWSEDAAREVIRVSFGLATSEADLDALVAEWRKLFERRRAA